MHRESLQRAVRIIISDYFVPQTSEIIFSTTRVKMRFIVNLALKPGLNRSKRTLILRSDLSNRLPSSMTRYLKKQSLEGPVFYHACLLQPWHCRRTLGQIEKTNSSLFIAGVISMARGASFSRWSPNVSPNKYRYLKYSTKLLILLVIRSAPDLFMSKHITVGWESRALLPSLVSLSATNQYETFLCDRINYFDLAISTVSLNAIAWSL